MLLQQPGVARFKAQATQIVADMHDNIQTNCLLLAVEKFGFPAVVEETLTIQRLTRAMPVYQFVLAMVLALYVGFARLNPARLDYQRAIFADT